MIHSLLQKGTGITGDWLSFYLISLGFPLHRIRLSFPLWSTRKTQLPLLGLAKDISSTQKLKCFFCVCGLFCHCDKQNRLDVKHIATIFLCPYYYYYYHYYYLIYLQLENLKRTSSKKTWGLWHSSYSNSSKTMNILKVFFMIISYNKSNATQLHVTTFNTGIISRISVFPPFIALWVKIQGVDAVISSVHCETDRQTFRFSCDCVWVKRATSRRARPK